MKLYVVPKNSVNILFGPHGENCWIHLSPYTLEKNSWNAILVDSSGKYADFLLVQTKVEFLNRESSGYFAVFSAKYEDFLLVYVHFLV